MKFIVFKPKRINAINDRNVSFQFSPYFSYSFRTNSSYRNVIGLVFMSGLFYLIKKTTQWGVKAFNLKEKI